MTIAPLETLVREQRALIAALDADDAEAIGLHSDTMEQAVQDVRNGRFDGAAARALVEEARTLADEARARINILADHTAQKLARLAAATGKGDAAPTYGRSGRLGR